MPLPSTAKSGVKLSRLAVACANRLLESPSDRERFLEALTTPPPYPATVLWCQEPASPLPFEPLPPLPWQPPWVSRFAAGSRTGQHPLHEAGAYYCLDSS
ncbi:hypothetical protein [Thermosynechococcus sp.]|uniref:hypothetical protein n=1 Tax=Thermosynechococcus sp. TaxID=2814275 RepID=UPI00391CF1FD